MSCADGGHAVNCGNPEIICKQSLGSWDCINFDLGCWWTVCVFIYVRNQIISIMEPEEYNPTSWVENQIKAIAITSETAPLTFWVSIFVLWFDHSFFLLFSLDTHLMFGV